MKRSDFPWWLLAITLSLLLHLLLFLELGRWPLIATVPVDQARVTHVRLAFQPPLPQPEPEPEPEPAFDPEPEPEPEPDPVVESAVEPALEPEPIVEPVVEPEPEPVIQPQLKPESESKPQPKPKPKPKSKPKPKPTPKPENRSQPVAATPAPTQPVSEKPQPVPATAPLPSNDSAGRERYLATLLSLIERQKVYPKIARRRDIQGNVQVAFTVACNGTITGLQTHSGHKILQKSALEAVQKALPLPRPPTENPCPVKIKYAMVFKLN